MDIFYALSLSPHRVAWKSLKLLLLNLLLCCMTADPYRVVGPHPQGLGEKLFHLTTLTEGQMALNVNW